MGCMDIIDGRSIPTGNSFVTLSVYTLLVQQTNTAEETSTLKLSQS